MRCCPLAITSTSQTPISSRCAVRMARLSPPLAPRARPGRVSSRPPCKTPGTLQTPKRIRRMKTRTPRRLSPLSQRTREDTVLMFFRSSGLPHPGQCVTCSEKVSLVSSSSKNTHLYSRPTHQNSAQMSPPCVHEHANKAIFPPLPVPALDSNLYINDYPPISPDDEKNGPKCVAGPGPRRSPYSRWLRTKERRKPTAVRRPTNWPPSS
jgi:hypothetical protein